MEAERRGGKQGTEVGSKGDFASLNGCNFGEDKAMIQPKKPPATESSLPVEMDPEPLKETLTAWSGVVHLAQTFRSRRPAPTRCDVNSLSVLKTRNHWTPPVSSAIVALITQVHSTGLGGAEKRQTLSSRLETASRPMK